jgi:hypothetical protein
MAAAYTVTFINACAPYLQADGATFGPVPPNTTTTASGGQACGAVKTAPAGWFTPSVNITLGTSSQVVQLGAGCSAVCGAADTGATWYGVTVVGNFGMPFADKPTAIGNSTAVSFRVTDFTKPFSTLYAAVGKVTYYVFNVQKVTGAHNALVVTVSMYVPTGGYNAWDPRCLGSIYDGNDYPFVPGVAFHINTMNNNAGSTVFNSFGSVVRGTSDNNLRTGPCVPSTTAKYECVKGSSTANTSSTPTDMSDVFTLDSFTMADGSLVMKLRNYKLGYLYVTNTDSTDSNNYNLAWDNTKPAAMATSVLKNGLGASGQWTVVAVDKMAPDSYWWTAKCGNVPWAALNELTGHATYYLVWRSAPGSAIFVLQSGACLFDDTCDLANFPPGNGLLDIGISDKIYTWPKGRRAYIGWQVSGNSNYGNMKPIHAGDYISCGVQNQGLQTQNTSIGGYVYTDDNQYHVANEDFAASLASTSAPLAPTLTNAPQFLPNGPFHFVSIPSPIYWVVAVYNGYLSSPSRFLGCKNWHYQSQAINTNFYFTIANDAVTNLMSQSPTYAADCYAVVPYAMPFAVLESSAGALVCPDWAMEGLKGPPLADAPGTCPAAAPGKAHTCTTPQESLLGKPADRITAAGAFLKSVCSGIYTSNAATAAGNADAKAGGYSCMDLLGQPSNICSGFRTDNFAAACTLACAQNSSQCDQAKSLYCDSALGAASNDCACMFLSTSSFLNPYTNAVSSTGASIAVAYKDYVQHMNIETEQGGFGNCWWHACVLDPVPALQLSTAKAQCPAEYMACTTILQDASVTNNASVTLGEYNSCYIQQVVGPGGVTTYNPVTGGGTVVPSGDGGGGGGGGPSAAPGPVAGPAPAKTTPAWEYVVIVVGVLVVLGALCGVLYWLFKPRAAAEETVTVNG